MHASEPVSEAATILRRRSAKEWNNEYLIVEVIYGILGNSLRDSVFSRSKTDRILMKIIFRS